MGEMGGEVGSENPRGEVSAIRIYKTLQMVFRAVRAQGTVGIDGRPCGEWAVEIVGGQKGIGQEREG